MQEITIVGKVRKFDTYPMCVIINPIFNGHVFSPSEETTYDEKTWIVVYNDRKSPYFSEDKPVSYETVLKITFVPDDEFVKDIVGPAAGGHPSYREAIISAASVKQLEFIR